MNREEDFKQHSQRRWFAIGGCYWPPYRFNDADGNERVAVQELRAADMESECVIHSWLAMREPAPFTAAELVGFIVAVVAAHGPPRQGFLIQPDVWQSTEHLIREDHVSREQVELLQTLGFSWPEMSLGERYEVALHLQSAGLDLAWTEEEIPNLDELLDH